MHRGFFGGTSDSNLHLTFGFFACGLTTVAAKFAKKNIFSPLHLSQKLVDGISVGHFCILQSDPLIYGSIFFPNTTLSRLLCVQ